jgi:hypothetical protein
MLVNFNSGYFIFALYQKAGNNGVYPKFYYKLAADCTKFSYDCSITVVNTKMIPNNVIKVKSPYPMGKIDHVNFASLGDKKATTGFWASFTPGNNNNNLEQIPYETWFASLHTDYIQKYSNKWAWEDGVFKMNGLSGGRMYGGGVTSDSFNDADKNYLIHLDSGKYKICGNLYDSYPYSLTEFNIYYSDCLTGSIDGGIPKSYYVRDANFAKSRIGVYNLVERASGKLSSGIMNPMNATLPQIDLGKSLAAVNQRYLSWVDMRLGSEPVLKMLRVVAVSEERDEGVKKGLKMLGSFGDENGGETVNLRKSDE